MWKHVSPLFLFFYWNGVLKKKGGGEKISIKLQYRLQRFIIWLEPFFSPLQLYYRPEMIWPPRWLVLLLLLLQLWMLLMPSSAAEAAAVTTCVVNILHGSVRWLFLFSPPLKILMVRRTTGYWLTVDMSDFSEWKARGMGYIQIGFQKKEIKGNPHVSTLRNPSSSIISNSYSRYPTVLTFKNQNILEKIVNSTDIVINCWERRIFIYLLRRRRNKKDPLLMNDFAASSFLFFCSFGLFFVFQRAVRGTHTTKKRIVSVCLSEDGVCRAHGPGDHYRNGSALFITGFQENKQIEREDNVFSFILSQAFFCNIFFFFWVQNENVFKFFYCDTEESLLPSCGLLEDSG